MHPPAPPAPGAASGGLGAASTGRVNARGGTRAVRTVGCQVQPVLGEGGVPRAVGWDGGVGGPAWVPRTNQGRPWRVRCSRLLTFPLVFVAVPGRRGEQAGRQHFVPLSLAVQVSARFPSRVAGRQRRPSPAPSTAAFFASSISEGKFPRRWTPFLSPCHPVSK